MVTPETQNQVEERQAPAREERRKDRASATGVVVGSSAEVIAGVGAIVVAILGLVGVLPLFMAAIATIAIGAAILLEGAAVASRMAALRADMDGAASRFGIGGGLTAEVLGGGAGVVLGVLALVGIMPLVLLPVAALVYGGTLLLAGATRPAWADLSRIGIPQRRAEDRALQVTEAAISSSGGAMVLAGAAAAILGILVLAEVAPPIGMSLIAMLVVGSALLLSGSALAARMGRTLRT